MRWSGYRPLVGIGVVGLMLWSCSITGPAADTRGTVELATLDEGCWAIRTDSEVYEPISLAAEFRVDGLRVQFRGERDEHYKSACMVGVPIKLTKIERLSGP